MNIPITLRNRLVAMAAMAGGAAWVAAGAIHLTAHDDVAGSDVDTTIAHVMLGLFSAALLLTAPAVLTLARYARTPKPAYVAVGGMVLLAGAATVSNIVGKDPLFFLVAAPLANFAWLVGSVGLAVSLYRAGEVSKFVAIGLPLVQVFALPLSVLGGPVIAGAYWIAVGYLLSVDGLRSVTPRPALAS